MYFCGQDNSFVSYIRNLNDFCFVSDDLQTNIAQSIWVFDTYFINDTKKHSSRYGFFFFGGGVGGLGVGWVGAASGWNY